MITKYTTKLISLISLMFCFSCSAHFVKKHRGIDPAIEPYISEIIEGSEGKLTRKHFDFFSMGFDELDPKTLGVCKPLVREMSFKTSYWSRTSEEGRLELVMHEVGHCILNRYHTNPKFWFLHDVWIDLGFVPNTGYLNDFCPSSIMHPSEMGWYCFIKHKKYYMDELFGRTDAESYESIPWRPYGDIPFSR